MNTRVLAALAAVLLVLVVAAAFLDAVRAQTPPAAVTSSPTGAPTATVVAATTTRAVAAPAASPNPRSITEAQAWAQIRSGLPAGAPIAPPTWLPASVDRDHVELQGVVGDPNDPRFVLTYRGAKGTIVYALGPASEIVGSGYGTRVRGVPAVLRLAFSLQSDPNSPAPRRILWMEGGQTLSISSETYSGDDLLHIAYSLDPAGAPAPKNAFVRLALGACARAGATAEETVRTLISLTGRKQADAALDCFSNAYIGEYGPGIGTMWGGLPTATLDAARQWEGPGGRMGVQATWTFASDPGGPWGQRGSSFFTLGLEDGAWRIHEMGSAAIAPPP